MLTSPNKLLEEKVNEDECLHNLNKQFNLINHKYETLTELLSKTEFRPIHKKINLDNNNTTECESCIKLHAKLNSTLEEIKTKEDKNQALLKDLELAKEKNNDKMNQLKHLLKEYEMSPNVNLRKRTLNRESMSSINTNVTTSTYTECDRLTKENIALENQLVSFKLKFAENSSKIMELEDQLSSIKRKLDLANDKHKTKDDIIKSLIQERDALRNEVIKYQDRSSIDNITTEFKMVTYFNNPKVTHKSSSNNNLPRVIKADNETKTNRSILIPTGKRDNSKKR